MLTADIWSIPLSEEWALVTAGYLYYSDQVQPVTILIVAGLGVFFGDFVAFWLERRWIKTRPHSPFPVLGRSKLIQRFKTWLDRHSSRALFWTRFLPGVRLPAHIVVEAHSMPIDTYIRISPFAVTIYVPIIFVCAYSFAPEIDAAFVSVQRFANAAWIIPLVTIISVEYHSILDHTSVTCGAEPRTLVNAPRSRREV